MNNMKEQTKLCSSNMHAKQHNEDHTALDATCKPSLSSHCAAMAATKQDPDDGGKMKRKQAK